MDVPGSDWGWIIAAGLVVFIVTGIFWLRFIVAILNLAGLEPK